MVTILKELIEAIIGLTVLGSMILPQQAVETCYKYRIKNEMLAANLTMLPFLNLWSVIGVVRLLKAEREFIPKRNPPLLSHWPGVLFSLSTMGFVVSVIIKNPQVSQISLASTAILWAAYCWMLIRWIKFAPPRQY
jgi:hypothetical protein